MGLIFDSVQEIGDRPHDRKVDSLRNITVLLRLPSENYPSYIEGVLSVCRRADIIIVQKKSVMSVKESGKRV